MLHIPANAPPATVDRQIEVAEWRGERLRARIKTARAKGESATALEGALHRNEELLRSWQLRRAFHRRWTRHTAAPMSDAWLFVLCACVAFLALFVQLVWVLPR